MAKETFYEQLTKGLADAVKDIREKVVEEPTWGRSLSGPEGGASDGPMWPPAQQTPAVGSLQQTKEISQEQDKGMDR